MFYYQVYSHQTTLIDATDKFKSETRGFKNIYYEFTNLFLI